MRLKKVLVAYSSRPPIIEYLARAFGKKGIATEAVYADENTWFDRYVIHHVNKTAHNFRILPKGEDFFRDHPLAHLHYRSTRLLEKVNAFSPDLVIIIRGIRFREDVLTEIRKGRPIFGWWIEKEERMEEAFRELDLYDHYFFMNSSCVDEGRKRGFANKISLLNHSVDPAAFYRMEAGKKYDWCFAGGWSPKRQAFIDSALRVSRNAVIYGPRWIKKNPFNFTLRRVVKGDYIGGEDLVRLYNESRLVLNVTNWGFGEGEKRSGMNMRVLEAPACGSALLTDGSRELAEMVTPGTHVILYEGVSEFVERLAYYLKNGEERERIAEAGYTRVRSNYTFDRVAEIIASVYENARQEGSTPVR